MAEGRGKGRVFLMTYEGFMHTLEYLTFQQPPGEENIYLVVSTRGVYSNRS